MTRSASTPASTQTSAELGPEGFRELFVNDLPLLDMRAPIEFAAGAFPTATNIPLLDDEQRHVIGSEYASHGQQSAIDLGLKMATADIRRARLEQWSAFVASNPEGYLYCFRGGLRSQISQRWLRETGVEYPLISGGYKALRRYLLAELERLCANGRIIVLSGATGVGKTELIERYPFAIDLEGRARHRGSAFGRMFEPQPTQIDWENQIVIDWLKAEAAGDLPVLIENESHLIGRIALPQVLREAMAKAPMLVLEADMKERITRLSDAYVGHRLDHYQANVEDPWEALEADVRESVTRIRRRLGDQRYQQICDMLPSAVAALRDDDDGSGFSQIIEILLCQYYDGLYRYQLEKQQGRIVQTGSMAKLDGWLTAEYGARVTSVNASVGDSLNQ